MQETTRQPAKSHCWRQNNNFPMPINYEKRAHMYECPRNLIKKINLFVSLTRGVESSKTIAKRCSHFAPILSLRHSRVGHAHTF